MKILKNWQLYAYNSDLKNRIYLEGNTYNDERYPDAVIINTSAIKKIDIDGIVTTATGSVYKLGNTRKDFLIAVIENKKGYKKIFCITFEDFIRTIFCNTGNELHRIVKEINGKTWTDYYCRANWSYHLKKLDTLKETANTVRDFEKDLTKSYGTYDKITINAFKILDKMCKKENCKITVYSKEDEVMFLKHQENKLK